jgi:uncharacterized membrane protein
MGFLLLGLLLLAMPVISLILAVSARNRVGAIDERLQSQARAIAALTDEIRALRAGEIPPSQKQAMPQDLATEETPAAADAVEAGETTSDRPDAEAETAAAESGDSGGTASPEGQPQGPSTGTGVAGPKRDLESVVGGRWTVILGGLATALGAVLLVRATIEAGLLGPAARIVLAALFSAALFGVGEVLRRRDRRFAVPAFPNADIPAILTGAAVVAAFATVFAAYALYGFIGPAGAFLALAVVGLASLALSAVHGQGLAALGVVASYATPLLVSSENPNLYALAAHVIVVTASTLGIAALRGWLWLALAGVAGASAWTVLAAFFGEPGSGFTGIAMLVGAGLIYVVAFGHHMHGSPREPEDQQADWPALLAFGALAAVFIVQAVLNLDLPLLLAGILVSVIAAATAVAWPAIAPAALASAAVAIAAIAALDLDLAFEKGLFREGDIAKGLVPPDTAAYVRNVLFVSLPAAAVLVFGVFRSAARAPAAAGWLASGAGAIAFLGLVIAYMRVAPFETSRLFGFAGLVLAFAFGAGVEAVTRMRPTDMRAPAPAAFAVAAMASLSLAIAVTLDTGWMPLAFSLACAGIAFVHGVRPIWSLPGLALAAAMLTAGTLASNLPFGSDQIGTTPFFNQLILLVGLPALALVAGGEWMRRNGAGLAANGTLAVGLALAGLFIALEVRHWLNAGTLAGGAPGLGETATYALAALGFSLGLQRVATLTGANFYANATAAAGAVSAIIIGIGLLVLRNPLFDAASIGDGLVFNLLLPGYLLTAMAAGCVAIQARPVRPRWYVLAFAALAGMLLFMWVTLSIRHYWQGEAMQLRNGADEAEVWTYSIAWLLMGVAILAIGHLLGSRPIRAASGILIALTVTKVFLVDLSALTGAMRAFSFIGLGISLLAIGRFYQRILLPAREPPSSELNDNEEPGGRKDVGKGD